MSMPTFPKNDPPLSREGSLNEIIASIAAEELSLSHILNAEGEKLQYVLGTLPGLDEAASLDEVIRINQSVKDTLSGIMERSGVVAEEVAFIGDDIPDMEVFDLCGLSVTVADAPEYVKARADLVLACGGGLGAFREISDMITSA